MQEECQQDFRIGEHHLCQDSKENFDLDVSLLD